MMYAFGQALYYEQLNQPRDSAIHPIIQLVLDVQDSMDVCLCEINNYDQKRMINLDRAATLRIAERRDSAMQVLDSMYQWLQNGYDTALVNQFYCIIEGEDKILDSTITWSQWDSLYTCEFDTSSGGGGSGTRVGRNSEYENKAGRWNIAKEIDAQQPDETQDNEETTTRIAMADEQREPSMLVYPNPADNKVLVKAEGLTPGKAVVILRDMIGRVVLEKELTTNGSIELNLEIEQLQAGVYHLTLQDKINKLSVILVVE